MSWKSPGNLLGWICRHPVLLILYQLNTRVATQVVLWVTL